MAAGFCSAAGPVSTSSISGVRQLLAITHAHRPRKKRFCALASTAVVMPIFNEDVTRVFEALRVIYGSVKETGQLQHFDFFILSDSNQPNQWIEEEVAWTELCKQVAGLGKIFYRKRRQAINKKAGNVADFLRHWGKKYRYMIVLDADSIMTGESLVRLVALMEKSPQTGIIQTAPRLVYGETPVCAAAGFRQPAL